MAESKPIASLSSGLLARKGAARPAMRRQGLNGLMPQAMPQDDLGWNDMGYDVDPPHDAPLHDEGVPHYGNLLAGAIPDAIPEEEEQQWVAPQQAVPDVVRQQAEIEERMAEPAPVTAIVEPEPAPEPVVQEPEPEPAIELEQGTQVLSVKKRKAGAEPAEPVELVVSAAPVRAIAPVAATAAARRAAFTLRLDAQRHLRLRLASAVTGQSAQQLVTAALDELLTKIPEIEDLAGRVPRSAAR